ncbi:MAG TPA: signal peptide peptidase SppA [Dongiaceae bacterium]
MKFVKFLAKSVVVIFALIGVLVVLGIFAIGAAWRSLPGVAIAPPPASMVLTLDLADGLSEAAPDSPLSFAGLDKSVTMLDAVRGIEAAAKDSRVKVLLLHLGSGELDLAHAQELGDAVADFRKSGKFALAFAESFGEAGSGGSHYLLATSANEVWLQPSGDLQLAGAALQSPFLRGLFDKLGIVARMDRREEYKGALDSLTVDSMTPPVRANLQLLVDAWVDQLAAGIAHNRHLDPKLARQLIDQGPYGAPAAKTAGLVDATRYWDEAVAAAKEHAGSDSKTFSLADYVGSLPDPVKGTPRIAVIYGVGDVVLGKGDSNPLFGKLNMGSQTVGDALHKAIDDSDIAGIVLRIDSPGGSYVAADAIWREVKRAKDKGKPLVVSMAGVAASGGYFVAAPAAAIVAEPGTITGSIGVFGGKFLFKDLLAKIGVTVDGVSTGTNALMESTTQDYTPDQWAKVEADLDRVYADFIDKVGQGRHLGKQAVEAIAKGQVWSGTAAKQNGLVDQLGGLMTAVALLRPLAKIAPDAQVAIEPYPSKNDRLQAAIARLMGTSNDTANATSLTRLLRVAGPLLSALDVATNPAADERLRAPLP